MRPTPALGATTREPVSRHSIQRRGRLSPRPWLFAVACGLLVACAALPMGSRAPDGAASEPAIARPGGAAPDFALPSIDGSTVRLSDLRGQVVFINFWATWCTPCREEMPLMQEVYEQYRDRGLVILAVDMEEDERLVRRWVEQGGYSFTFLLDSDGAQVKRYNVTGAPASYLLSRDGVIREVKVGPFSRADLVTRVERLLAS